MTGVALLNWARGPGLQVALVVFVVGTAIRLLEMWLLGRSPDLAEARGSAAAGGWRTLFTRSLPMPGALKRAPLVFLGGYVFHLGFFIAFLFYAPHILFLRGATGFGWPALPAYLIDVIGLASMVALVALLVNRVTDPVRRFLSRAGDYVAWTATFLPLLTGYFAYHRLVTDYTTMLALHVLSFELLLVLIPFTKLMHTFTFAVARWYNGAIAGRRGVKV
jgi:nitrate reductase gamma subunit